MGSIYIQIKLQTSILIVAPGLYEVLVNGEAIFSTRVDENYNEFAPKATRAKAIGKHPSGNITGSTLSDFIVLPARARVSIVYDGDIGSEGFLSLKRL